MATKIRLKRMGSKKRPYYRLVVADSRAKRDGNVIESIGTYMPLEAEKFLTEYRLNFLESLRPLDSFSEDYVYYYYIRLKLLQRMREFNEKAGEITYKNIYNSIMNGDKTEAM